jgi:hypothetical protein
MSQCRPGCRWLPIFRLDSAAMFLFRSNMPRRTTIKRLEPSYDRDGRLLFFMTGKPDRRAPPDFLNPEEVPEPEKGAGWFECERARVGPWMKWKALRRVDSD